MDAMILIKQIAEQALLIKTSAGGNDSFLLDRAERLIRNVNLICHLPELANAGFQVDKTSLLAAAYFYDAALAKWISTKRNGQHFFYSDRKIDGMSDLSRTILEEKLAGVLDKSKINKISEIIAETNEHFTKMTEAMILSDARNLDDMGAAGLINDLRRSITEGKTISDILGGWQRKIDYNYWQARLRESFRFESVRKIAEKRFTAANYFMNELRIENVGKDIEKSIVKNALV